jgi:two-component system, response regulator FlrC
LQYRWPGNVRQLENTIQRGMILSHDGVIHASTLGIPLADDHRFEHVKTRAAGEAICLNQDNLQQHGRHAQYQYIADLMRQYQGNRSKIADFLGITPRALRYRLASMRKQGIDLCF